MIAPSPGATNLLPTASLSTKNARMGVEFVSNV